ncbi:MAG: vitamin B12 dependent-methionine synthase activation domain-containing protein [Erysipelotrichaceae bacterium]|nr:vitamin B12 dependent-methionine synthase activation domain-containing protein [Erysipelotrichaceae bacterium]
MNISRKEIRRYLGMMNAIDEETDSLIEECVALLEQTAHPRYIYVRFPLIFREGYPCIESHMIRSRNLADNLAGCREVTIMAVTLGADVDRLIQRYSILSMSKAAVLQAASAAMCEEVCDHVNRMITIEAKRDHMKTHPRFSPGYGDLDLSTQKLIFSLINLPKEIGLTLNDSLLMTPFKSVTAFIGLEAADTDSDSFEDHHEEEDE